MDTVVIGAGWAGLTAAREMAWAGHEVVVLEKSRGPGGRSSTRRNNGARFDHGAQYFTARSAAFGRQLQQWRDAGLVRSWRPRIAVFGDKSAHQDSEDVTRFVAMPGMNGVCRHMAQDLDCRFEQRVTGLHFDRQWRLELESGDSLQARRLLITAPPAQAAALLGAADPLHDQLAGVSFAPCIAGLLSFEKPLDPGFDAAFVNQPGALSWVACNSTKPGREGNNWVLHAGAQWSKAHIELAFEEMAERLAGAFVELAGSPVPPLAARQAHRWRYAQAEQPLDTGLLVDPARRLAIAGDWLAGSRIEGAWTSGRKAGEWLADSG
ncbi:MAG: FAD-dependent oxidoreductase [Wenzhouxiangellaceae bacterium]